MKTHSILILILAAFIAFPAVNAQKVQRRTVVKTVSDSVKSGAWLGVALRDPVPELAGKGESNVTGALVAEVVDESPADSAGIEDGDVITRFDGKAITGPKELTTAVGAMTPGTRVAIELRRGKETKTVTAVLGEVPAHRKIVRRTIRIPGDGTVSIPPVPPVPHVPGVPAVPGMHGFGFSANRVLGMRVLTLGEQLGAYFGAPHGKGVLVEEVKEGSAAAKAGFKAGDVIVRAGRKTIEHADDVRTVLAAHDAGEKVPVEILRKGTPQTLTIIAEKMDDGMGAFRHFRIFNDDDEDESGEAGEDDEDVDIRIDLRELDGSLQQLRDELPQLEDSIRIQVERALRDAGRALEKAGEAGAHVRSIRTRINHVREL